jgi:hypothetical protein
MPNPVVIPIFWGSAYVKNLTTQANLTQMFKDLVTGPFMNGLVQYGVFNATMVSPIIIDDPNPPAKIVYTTSSTDMPDDITHKLISWIHAGTVPAPPSPDDRNTLYMILPPTESIFEIFNGDGDPIGNGVQGFHNSGVTNPAGPPTFYWGIVKTGDCPDPSTIDFVNCVSKKVCHELAEQCSDIDHSWGEVGDSPCNDQFLPYRGWTVQPYWSDWATPPGCQPGDTPVSIRAFLNSIGFDTLRALNTNVINIPFIATTMQSQPAPALPKTHD